MANTEATTGRHPHPKTDEIVRYLTQGKHPQWISGRTGAALSTIYTLKNLERAKAPMQEAAKHKRKP